MSKQLNDHLYPKGRSAAEPDLMPNVLDSDGAIVTFNSTKRKTTEATVVNLGDSPNSNNGDPLRTAFAKVNNFIEASYWANEGVNQEFTVVYDTIDSEIAIVNARIDSELRLIHDLFDSEYTARVIQDAVHADMLDSDSIVIQTLGTLISSSFAPPSATLPTQPTDGMLFFKTDTRELNIYDAAGSNGWVVIGTIAQDATSTWVFNFGGGTF